MPRERLIGIIGVLVLLAVAVGIAVVADRREPVRLGPERDDPGYSVPPTPTLTP